MNIDRQIRTFFITLAVLAPLAWSVADAGIINWQTGETIPGTENIVPVAGTHLRFWNSDDRNLRFADFQGLNLTSTIFFGVGWTALAFARPTFPR